VGAEAQRADYGRWRRGGEEGGKKRLGLRRSNGRDVLHESQTMKDGEKKFVEDVWDFWYGGAGALGFVFCGPDEGYVIR